MKQIPFTKMHGAGNDFVIIDNRSRLIPESEYSDLARHICERKLSLGADGMMIVTDGDLDSDYGMLFFNSDGSMGEMCGNGARCIARYGREKGLAGDIQRIRTTAGIVIGTRIDELRYQVRLNNPSEIRSTSILDEDFGLLAVTYVELGSPGIPHAIVPLPQWQDVDTGILRELGRKLRWHKEFPKGANITFYHSLCSNRYKTITFERGVEDFTLACGTGAGSTAMALYFNRICTAPVSLEFPGGLLEVEVRQEDGAFGLYLTGPTCLVAEGTFIHL